VKITRLWIEPQQSTISFGQLFPAIQQVAVQRINDALAGIEATGDIRVPGLRLIERALTGRLNRQGVRVKRGG